MLFSLVFGNRAANIVVFLQVPGRRGHKLTIMKILLTQ